jgi:tryptophan-rich sensory protein/membrane-associated phospholipid phosphatase
VIFEVLEDVGKLALVVGFLYALLGVYVRRRRPAWFEPLQRRRLATVLALVLASSAVKLGEDVLGHESGAVDKAILLFIHRHVPDTATGFFEAVTLTGSTWFLLPLAAAATAGLLYARRRAEALLVAASAAGGAALVYFLKSMVGRTRPELWNTEWYWGSSFPSGHTLVVAAFATAAALGAARIRPAWRAYAAWLAVLWIALVGMSRLVLGVHWPTDVAVAACAGAMLPLAMSVWLELHGASRRAQSAAAPYNRAAMARSPASKLVPGLIGWLVVSFAAAAAGGVASANAGAFYLQLARPGWAPPGWLFGPVWSVLYLMMGVAAWLVWKERGFGGARAALSLFLAQLAANALWTWLFFAWRQGALAFAEILVLWALIAATIAAFWQVRPAAGALLLPYLAWVTFASALCFAMWRLNPALLA